MCPRGWLVSGAVLAFLAVALGAFGAHGLPEYLASRQIAEEVVPRRIEQFETAVRYHMYHALAILAVGLIAHACPTRGVQVAGYCFLVGIAIFSGCLYLLVLTGHTFLGAIVPIGGVAMLVGWVALAWGTRCFGKNGGAAACSAPLA